MDLLERGHWALWNEFDFDVKDMESLMNLVLCCYIQCVTQNENGYAPVSNADRNASLCLFTDV